MAKSDIRQSNHATMEAIIELAATMLTQNGYNGVSFLSLGKQLGIGHSNIHYYFKTKDDLVEHVLRRYTDDALEFFRLLWRDPSVDLRTKMERTRDWLRSNFDKYSSKNVGGRIGLLGSLASDVAHLSPNARKILREINLGLDDHIRTGIDLAIEHGHLGSNAPREDIAQQILWLLYSSRIIVRHGNTFEKLDSLFRWTMDVIETAYPASRLPGRGRSRGRAAAKPQRKPEPTSRRQT